MRGVGRKLAQAARGVDGVAHGVVDCRPLARALAEVVAGQARPLMRAQPLLCPEIHGETGLDGPLGGPVLPPAERGAVDGKAVTVMYDRISAAFRESGDRVRLVATGALSNVALLIILYPEVLEKVEICVMGGCVGVGNTGPVQEFNIQTDPEAAKVVFSSGAQVTMVPLEVSERSAARPPTRCTL